MNTPDSSRGLENEPTPLYRQHMGRALQLASKGLGLVEPNPMVGCVIAHGEEIVGEGWHAKFGLPHAEVMALEVAGQRARGATMFVTLEPCCHEGKTPPCTKAVIAAGIANVVIALADPFPQVSGGGIAELRAAGIQVESGVCETEARELCAPYLKLVTTGRPWVIAKWAMTLDGKIATRSGESKWISGEESRRVVHELRGRMDAILIGRHTQILDDPLLTARPPGVRAPVRIVLDSQAQTAVGSQLVQTARETPTLIACAASAPQANEEALVSEGCEVFRCAGDSPHARLESLLDELGRRRMTNILVEGGGQVLGGLRDLNQIDEFHAFIAPKLLGQSDALFPFSGEGAKDLQTATELCGVRIRQLGEDVYVTGRSRKWEAESGKRKV